MADRAAIEFGDKVPRITWLYINLAACSKIASMRGRMRSVENGSTGLPTRGAGRDEFLIRGQEDRFRALSNFDKKTARRAFNAISNIITQIYGIFDDDRKLLPVASVLSEAEMEFGMRMGAILDWRAWYENYMELLERDRRIAEELERRGLESGIAFSCQVERERRAIQFALRDALDPAGTGNWLWDLDLAEQKQKSLYSHEMAKLAVAKAGD